MWNLNESRNTTEKKPFCWTFVMSRKGGSECNPSCRVGYVPSSQVYASSSNLISFLKEIFFDNCSFVFADLQALGNRIHSQIITTKISRISSVSHSIYKNKPGFMQVTKGILLIILIIREYHEKTGFVVGFKPAGGIR